MEDKKSGRARLVFLLWLLVSIFYFYLASDYVRASMKDDEFGDYLVLPWTWPERKDAQAVNFANS